MAATDMVNARIPSKHEKGLMYFLKPKKETSNEKNNSDNSNTDKRDCANGTKRTTTTTTAAGRTAMWATTAITITTPAPTATATPIHYFVGTPERLNHSLQNCTPKSFQLMWFVVSKCFQWRPYCWTTHPPLAGTEFAHCSYARAMRGPRTFGGQSQKKKTIHHTEQHR